MMYTKRFYLCHQKVSYLKIIWFYLVRAEVVLWWHCLIFFARAKSRQKKRYMVGNWLEVGYFCRSFHLKPVGLKKQNLRGLSYAT